MIVVLPERVGIVIANGYHELCVRACVCVIVYVCVGGGGVGWVGGWVVGGGVREGIRRRWMVRNLQAVNKPVVYIIWESKITATRQILLLYPTSMQGTYLDQVISPDVLVQFD